MVQLIKIEEEHGIEYHCSFAICLPSNRFLVKFYTNGEHESILVLGNDNKFYIVSNQYDYYADVWDYWHLATYAKWVWIKEVLEANKVPNHIDVEILYDYTEWLENLPDMND